MKNKWIKQIAKAIRNPSIFIEISKKSSSKQEAHLIQNGDGQWESELIEKEEWMDQ